MRPMWLKLALGCWLVSAGADDLTTYQALQYPTIIERNPLIQPLRHRPGWATTELIAGDVLGTWVTLRHIAPHHRKLAVAVFVAGTVTRGYFAVRNVQTMREMDRRAVPVFTPY
jgi:hypothetical protein